MCSGSGSVVIDSEAIAAALVSTRGKSKGKFRSSRPKLPEEGGVYGAAYVWRMIRFDIGQDMTMPVMAGDYVGCIGARTDLTTQVLDVLDEITDVVGKQMFGAMTMRGAAAWGRVLGFEGAEEVYAKVDDLVGIPMGNGSAIGNEVDSPEAAVESAMDGDGLIDFEDCLFGM